MVAANGITIASWRDCASSVPSAAQIMPSSTKKPSWISSVRVIARHSSFGSGSGWTESDRPALEMPELDRPPLRLPDIGARKWTVRSTVGTPAGSVRRM